MKIYALFNGEYSDTRLVGVYSTQENADLAATLFADSPSIEEHEVDAASDLMARGYKLYFVRLSRATGDMLECYVQESAYGAYDSRMLPDIKQGLYTNCWAEHDAHAIKIAGERRREFLATEQVHA